jgi:hypothetical protein
MTIGAVYLPLLLSSTALLISIFSFFFFKSYLKRRTGQEQILAEMREEVNNILRTINETTDRDISLIEEREKVLRDLLNEIEKRIKVYIREMEGCREAENTYKALRSEEPGRKPSAAYAALGSKRYKKNVQDTASQAKAESVPSVEAEPVPPPLNPPSMGEQIRSLLRSGISETVIASRLGVSIAEVEFAAALLERRDGK